jgi:DNA polymerase III epsilon subunit-like protein
MSLNKYIAFDCETTGLDDKSNLLTVSFIILDKHLNKKDSVNISLKQGNGYYVTPYALEVNKIDIIKHHNTSLDLIDARKLLLKFLDKNYNSFCLIPIGHNVNFDIKFIKKSGLLTDKEWNKYISCNSLDTISVAQFLKLSGKLHERTSLSLINLCNSCNLERNEQLEHSSAYDIEMTIKLLKHFLNLENKCEQNKKRKLF